MEANSPHRDILKCYLKMILRNRAGPLSGSLRLNKENRSETQKDRKQDPLHKPTVEGILAHKIKKIKLFCVATERKGGGY